MYTLEHALGWTRLDCKQQAVMAQQQVMFTQQQEAVAQQQQTVSAQQHACRAACMQGKHPQWLLFDVFRQLG